MAFAASHTFLKINISFFTIMFFPSSFFLLCFIFLAFYFNFFVLFKDYLYHNKTPAHPSVSFHVIKLARTSVNITVS